MRKRRSRYDQPLMQTVEEAAALLRRLSVRGWLWWFAGTLPFLCVLMHFIIDMSLAANAGERLSMGAAMLALSYGWMKVAHCGFGDALMQHLRGGVAVEKLPLRGKLRVVTSQLLIHSTAPWMLPLTMIATLPFGWAYAAYHNVSILAVDHFRNGGRTRELPRLALQQANYRPGHNHGLILVLLMVAGLVWLNMLIGTVMFSTLAKAITGTDNELTRNQYSMFSSTIMGATVGLSYLIVGPLVKALYAMRCFRGLARKNGEDLLVAFRRAAVPLLLMLSCLGNVVHAQEQAVAPPAIQPTTLDQNIREVLKRDAFQWKMPRKKQDIPEGPMDGFMKDISAWLKSIRESVNAWFKRVMVDRIKEWFRELRGKKSDIDVSGDAATGWAAMTPGILKVILGIMIAILIVMVIRQWRRMPPPPAKAAAAAAVNLESEHVIASALPEQEWLRLAQEKMDAGDYRLALRALFLAMLAHLGERKLLRIAKSKSNGDYVRELALRARDRESLRGTFSDSVRVFDRAWYGWHEVTRELLEHFRSHHTTITADASR